MSYTLLQLTDQACGEMGLSQPSVVVGNGANQAAQILALTQRLGKDLIREFQWEQLVKAYRFTTTAALTKTGTISSGSAIITGMSNTTSLAAGMVASGTGIAPYAEILTNDSGNQITLDTPATASGSVTLTFAYQDYSLPADFDRMIPDTNWDRTNHWRNLGTKSSQDWQTLQGGLISTGPRERFRLYGGKLRIFPAVTTAYNLGFEYVSSYWVTATGGSAPTKTLFTVDSDTCIFQDDLMLAGLKYYFLRAKKLDYGIEMADFNDILSARKAQDVPQPALSLSPLRVPELIGPWSLPEGSWPTS